MTLMAVRTDHGALGAVYDLAEVDEASAQLLLQLALYDALCTEVDKVAPALEHALAGHFIREADGMLEQTAKRYTLAKSLGQPTDELEAIAEHLAQARTAWVEVSKALTPEQFDALESQGVINRDDASGRFTSGKIRRNVLNALGLATGKPDNDVDRRTHEALQGLVGGQADSYTRMRALGQGLIATGNTQARVAGTAARLVADIGPEAQRVLEPGIRRAAYRYRGTEKKPSKQSQLDAMAVADSALADLNSVPTAIQDRIINAQVQVNQASATGAQQAMAGPGRRAPSAAALSPMAAAIAANPNPKAEGVSEDQLQLARTSDYGALLLRTQVPDIDTAMLSLAAGKMPPSVGMMFDVDGRLVSEAQGFNGDHYLPFDLKNLKRLKGGSYVRTRTTGGLTDEDIYTGLMTGARQVTVVSNSGVFTLEFDPTLRGGRRYSDKARAMVQRYGALTKAIGSGGLQQTDIKPADMQELKRQAMQNSGGNADLAQTMFNDALEAKRFESSFVGIDEDALWRQATEEVAGSSARDSRPQQQMQVTERFKVLKAEALKNTAKKYKLDHDGYAAAQKALATEFPYFIREQKTTPLNEFLVSHRVLAPAEELPRRGGRDIGYTAPGELAPLKGADRREQSEQLRTGLKPRATGGPAPAPVDGAPAQTEQGQPKAQAPQSAAGAKGWEAAQQSATFHSATKLGRNLEVLKGVNLIPSDERPLPPVDENGKIYGLDSDDIFNATGLEYAAWVNSSRGPFTGSMRKYAEFLVSPEGQPHLEMAEAAITELGENLATVQDLPSTYGEDRFAEAAEALQTASGASFVPAESDWVLYDPDPADPKPQLVPDLEATGGDLDAIKVYAQRNPKVAARAAQLAEVTDEEVADEISTVVSQLSSLLGWDGQGDVPADVSIDPRQAMQVWNRLQHHPATEPMYADVAELQAAWSLERANRIAAAAKNTRPLDLADLGKARAPAPPGAQEMGKRLVIHAPDSPAAVGLAKRRAASPLLVRLPASR